MSTCLPAVQCRPVFLCTITWPHLCCHTSLLSRLGDPTLVSHSLTQALPFFYKSKCSAFNCSVQCGCYSFWGLLTFKPYISCVWIHWICQSIAFIINNKTTCLSTLQYNLIKNQSSISTEYLEHRSSHQWSTHCVTFHNQLDLSHGETQLSGPGLQYSMEQWQERVQ